jgi:hypothetical protein
MFVFVPQMMYMVGEKYYLYCCHLRDLRDLYNLIEYNKALLLVFKGVASHSIAIISSIRYQKHVIFKPFKYVCLQSTGHEKNLALEWRLWCGGGGMFTTRWT